MKIVVYAMCKNELHNVHEWIKSMSEADYVCVLDTGSTDGTYEELLKYKEQNPQKFIISQAIISPWRFDTARNESMKLIPADADACICTDLDERLTATWSDKIKAIWNPNDPRPQRGVYLYAWSHRENGEPARIFWYDKIHDNKHDWHWACPVHEMLEYNGSEELNYIYLPDDFVMLHHYPTYKASRGSYLLLLELRAQERPDDIYGLVYLAHEYTYTQQPDKAIRFINDVLLPKLQKPDYQDGYLLIPNLYYVLGKEYLKTGLKLQAEVSFLTSIQACPTYREPYVELGEFYYNEKRYQDAIAVLNKGLVNSRRKYSWLESDDAWTWKPWDLLSLCYWAVDAKNMSLDCAETAYHYNPTNARLKQNVDIIKASIVG